MSAYYPSRLSTNPQINSIGDSPRVISRFFYGYVFVGLLIISGALQRPIGGDSVEGTWTGAGVVHNTNYGILFVGAGFFGITGLISAIRFRSIKLPLWAFLPFALVILAFLSFLWSENPSVVLNRWFGLAGCTLFSVLAVSRLGVERTMAVLVIFFSIFFIVNFVLSFALYDYTHHSIHEALYAAHAGRLKGTYPHKNALGAVLSLGLVPVIIFGRRVLKSGLLTVAVILVGFYLLAATQAAQTFISLPLGLALGYALKIIRIPTVRVAATLVTLTLGSTFYLLGAVETMEELMLAGVGRDASLSGRTQIWSAAIGEALHRPLLGGGYQTGWEAGSGAAVRSVLGSDPGHAHNGFIELFIDLGAVGELLFLGFLASILAVALTSPSRNNDIYRFFLTSWLTVFALNNMAGSYILVPSDISWFLVIYASYIASRLAAGRRRRMVNAPAL